MSALVSVHAWGSTDGVTRGSDLGPYQGILNCWSSAAGLGDAIHAACDYHVSCRTLDEDDESGDECFEFSLPPINLVPLEIHALYRVRERVGLSTPVFDDPLLDPVCFPFPDGLCFEAGPLLRRVQARFPDLL